MMAPPWRETNGPRSPRSSRAPHRPRDDERGRHGHGAFALVLAALAGGETLAVPEEADTWLATAYLVVLGSVGVFA